MISAQEILKSQGKFRIKLGLERINSILDLLNHPEENLKIIHIAGTNGKGSTSKIINDILIEAGFKTGLFTSPHIFRYEERIKINNQNIKADVFNKLINEINTLAEGAAIDLTEFELLAAAAFYYFSKQKTDWVVLETGLGGLYDATNVIKHPKYTVITTIDFDHTERLGNTIEDIAYQKAGIIKSGTPVVVSPDNFGFSVVQSAAKKEKSQILTIPEVKIEFKNNKNYVRTDGKTFEFALLGEHQAKNLALALAVAYDLKIKDDIIKRALKNVHWDYRLQYDPSKNLLIDCAHNPSGIRTLRDFLDKNFKNTKKTFIFGCLKNKDYKKMLEILLHEEDEMYFVEFDYPSALKFEELEEKYKKRAKRIKGLNEVAPSSNLRVICGSMYMISSLISSL